MAAPSEPLAFEANMTGAHSATLWWRKPRQLNGKILLFKIRMRWRYKNVKGTYRFITKKIPAKVTPRERRRLRRYMMDYRVLRLEPVREIQLMRIQPFAFISVHVSEGTGITENEVFWSPWSNNYTLQTLEGAPSAPRNVELKQNKGASVKVTWLPPEYPNGIIQKYRIIYRNNSIKNYTAEVTKGLKNTSLFYILSGLHKDSTYQINVQAFTSFPGEVSPTVRRNIKTPGDVLEQGEVDTASLYGGVFAGIIAFVFVIIIVALVIRNHRKRRDATDLSGKKYAVANSNDSGIGDKESLDRVPGVKCVQGVRRGSEDVIGPGKFVTIKPIPIQRLPEYCAINHADRNKGFREEFLSIRVPGSFTWENSQKPENKAKNRFNSIIPYDHTRVTLTELEGSPGSDYINANFIDGYDHPFKFIATQGPVANTFGDFWRTVWEQGVCVVIMVTNIVEGGRVILKSSCLLFLDSNSLCCYLILQSFQQREAFIATQAPLENTVVDFWRMTWEYEAYSIVMLTTMNELQEGQCAYYLPRREEFIVYGLLMVEVETEDQRNGFCRRRLRVTNTKSGEIRSIYHFHFKEWAERSIPLNGMGLLDMMKCITRVQQQTGNGPIVIHCSDGSGRTGTFCAINVALERVKLDGTIDIFQTVRRLRTQRPLMVQTEEQYKLCYEITRLFVESFNDYSTLK
ncbi:PREDICTED: receptor-type tyrosine-protein phosphatase epsilon-like [Acropora digitifera]|uniref:receptor-type tyrosine-protein phosphatase epsilon-like n=1 Tax=Acropora digitifera TaxID=70779 RepID=UPI00077A87A9|nr:PREDICTED: receptor-type tyrosine-protein phosphatase epsilon-like [Acropora digitifera]